MLLLITRRNKPLHGLTAHSQFIAERRALCIRIEADVEVLLACVSLKIARVLAVLLKAWAITTTR